MHTPTEPLASRGSAPPPTRVFLLGDSILRNDAYVNHVDTVGFALRARLKPHRGISLHNFAVDGARIRDVLLQSNRIERGENDDPEMTTMIVLSIGGNDILELIRQSQTPPPSSSSPLFEAGGGGAADSEGGGELLALQTKVDEVFQKYEIMVHELLATFETRFRLLLLDLYYPPDPFFKTFAPLIRQWNAKLDTFARRELEAKERGGQIRVRELCTKEEDFVYFIEPAPDCARRISAAIAKRVVSDRIF